MRLRVYADRDHYTAARERDLNHILRALWDTGSLEERRSKWGPRADRFEFVSAPDAADLHLLTMKWPHYVMQNCVDQAMRALDVARRARRPFAVFSFSDHEANFPGVGPDIHVFETSAYRSRARTQVHGLPAFIDDPLASYCAGKVKLREKAAVPTVGFCGQAGASLARHAVRLLRNRAQRTRWRLGLNKWEPPPLEHTWFRQQIIDTFERSTAVKANFKLRTQYRAGVTSQNRNNPTEETRREFLDNVIGSDYTLCMRGGGNFSVRFYEALALGRLPAFIDTDCVLPYHDRIPWRNYVAWIDESELEQGPARVAEQYARMSDAEFAETQLECRQLWETRLSSDGFYAHFHEHFPELQS